MPSSQTLVGLRKRWRTVTREISPLTAIRTSLFSTGASKAISPCPPRKNSPAGGAASAAGGAAGAARAAPDHPAKTVAASAMVVMKTNAPMSVAARPSVIGARAAARGEPMAVLEQGVEVVMIPGPR